MLFAAQVPESSLRWRAYAMVLVLTAVAVVAQLSVFLGPAGAAAPGWPASPGWLWSSST